MAARWRPVLVDHRAARAIARRPSLRDVRSTAPTASPGSLIATERGYFGQVGSTAQRAALAAAAGSFGRQIASAAGRPTT